MTPRELPAPDFRERLYMDAGVVVGIRVPGGNTRLEVKREYAASQYAGRFSIVVYVYAFARPARVGQQIPRERVPMSAFAHPCRMLSIR